MKANELMIGDWVYSASMTPRKVQYLDGAKSDSIGVADHLNFESNISPLPIAPEFLEKNSFSDVDNSSINRQIGFVHWYHVDRIGALEEPLITQDLNSGTYSLVYRDNRVHGLRYVHELQHAFRLFWLNDLADKFTV